MGSDESSGTGWGEGAEGEITAAGDFGFDPLGLYGGFSGNEEGRKYMRLAEIKNGRAAMMAVLAYVVEEVVTGKPVTEVTPFLFAPFYKLVLNLMGATGWGEGSEAFEDPSIDADYLATPAPVVEAVAEPPALTVLEAVSAAPAAA